MLPLSYGIPLDNCSSAGYSAFDFSPFFKVSLRIVLCVLRFIACCRLFWLYFSL